MESLKEIFAFSRAETIALSLLMSICLIGGGILVYENSRQSLPPQLIFESLNVETMPQQAQSTNVSATMPASSDPAAQSQPRQITRGGNLVLNINSAPAESLALLPFIGQTLSGRIVDYRAKHGAFSSVDDLLRVYGIGPKNIEKMRPYLICN